MRRCKHGRVQVFRRFGMANCPDCRAEGREAVKKFFGDHDKAAADDGRDHDGIAHHRTATFHLNKE